MLERLGAEETKEATSTGRSRLVEEASYELAAGRGSAFSMCVAAVKGALADPAQNTHHVHRSEDWISARCSQAAETHEKNMRSASHQNDNVRHAHDGGGHSGGSSRGSHSDYEQREQERLRADERQRKKDTEESRKQQQDYERRRAADELQRERQQARTNHTGLQGDSFHTLPNGKRQYCPREGGACY